MNNILEVWKDIKNFENLYQISNLGRVKSLIKKGRKSERILKNFLDRCGYLNNILVKDKIKTKYKNHRLIAIAFIPNCKNKPCINHKDGNKQNNNIDNLEWVTYSENERHSYDVLKRKASLYGKKKINGKMVKVLNN